jgi:carbohydrate kinase (thermoresistant glucokinase family)
MSSGKPLNDEDRYDWLLKINKEITKRKNKQNLVVACSSLKESYRDLLGKNNFKLVYLKINKELASIRINSRTDHFMPSTLVDSQFLILEEPNDALVFNQDLTEIQIVNEIIIKLDLKLY